MTPTPSTRLPAHIFYAIMADAQERDPIQGGETVNRATVPMGRGFALWQRMNPDAHLVWVDDMEGRPRAVTPKQAMVLAMALEMASGSKGMTMRQMGEAARAEYLAHYTPEHNYEILLDIYREAVSDGGHHAENRAGGE